ncbi:MAG: hypothetical protein OEQ28_12630 [Acidobacteriota bacterium]|nr:hypothetical protein [Acidobacteriota bacterium]
MATHFELTGDLGVEETRKMRLKTNIIICGGLAVLALLALAVSHLALTDIRRQEGDLTAEWAALQVSLVVFTAFVLSTIALLPRVWKLASGGKSVGK